MSDELPNVKAEMAGAWQALDEPTREAMLWLTAHFYVRDGHINEDGSRGSLRMRGHADLLDLVSYATKQERERCAKICEAVAYDGCHVWRRQAIDECVADIRDKRIEKPAQHVCGLQGYNGMVDPPCPACEARSARCTRSHPHELMDEDCERLTVEAREAAAVRKG